MSIVGTLLLPLDVARFMLIAATPALAWAATEQHALRTTTLDSMSVFVWAAIVFFSLIGWAVNDLDHIAELWKDGENAYEKWKERMKLSKGVIASFAAGIFTYFICKTAPGPILGMAGLKPIDGHPIEIPEMIIFILVTGGAYMGTRWFAAVERKLTGKSKDDAAP